MRYRPEIDGLRALAVLPVVLFHAGLPGLPGGFVGVDVFFVISGYLITRQIVEEKRAGTFTLAGFWERRARRILPALFAMMALCLPLAWAWLTPGDFAAFARSVAATTLFASNVLFWRGSGYFGEAAELQPLLHTWSLAVEEQWYPLFPLAIVALWRLGRRGLFAVLATVALGSLALSQWAALERPAAAFFLLPGRAWELLAGALLALHGHEPEASRPATPRRSAQAAALAGLALLAIPMLVYDRHTPFPGLAAIAPVAGALLAIRFATPDTIVGRMLSDPRLVAIGTFSYGTYLWHQPLLAFARHRTGGEPDPLLLAGLVIASFALGRASLAWVERPLRDRSRIGRRTLVGAAASAAFGLGAAASAIVALDGVPARYDAAAQALLREGGAPWRSTMVVHGLGACFLDDHQGVDALRANRCVPPPTDRPRLVVLGDSEAAHLVHGLRRRFADGRFELGQWTGTGCAPVAHPTQTARCGAILQAFLDEVLPALRPIDRLVVSGDWLNLLERDGPERFERSLQEGFALLAAGRAPVTVTGDAPEFVRTPSELLVRDGAHGAGSASLRSRDFRPSSERVRERARAAGFGYFAPADALCRDGSPASCRVLDPAGLLWLDARHLSSRSVPGKFVSAIEDRRRNDPEVARRVLNKPVARSALQQATVPGQAYFRRQFEPNGQHADPGACGNRQDPHPPGAGAAAAAAQQGARGGARVRRLRGGGPRGHPPRGVQPLACSLGDAARDVRATCPSAPPSPRARPQSHAVNACSPIADTARCDKRVSLAPISRLGSDPLLAPDQGEGV
jgi:peptidoglycan/LPS O-acetylase OafA/YrhL